jgi:hypothetical protein
MEVDVESPATMDWALWFDIRAVSYSGYVGLDTAAEWQEEHAHHLPVPAAEHRGGCRWRATAWIFAPRESYTEYPPVSEGSMDVQVHGRPLDCTDEDTGAGCDFVEVWEDTYDLTIRFHEEAATDTGP